MRCQREAGCRGNGDKREGGVGREVDAVLQIPPLVLTFLDLSGLELA